METNFKMSPEIQERLDDISKIVEKAQYTDIAGNIINEYEKKMLFETKNPFELLAEEKSYIPPVLTQEQINKQTRADTVNKIKVCALSRMDKYPLANPGNFSRKDKTTLLNYMEEYNSKSMDELTNEFNNVCIDKLFSDNNDYSNYPIYNLTS